MTSKNCGSWSSLLLMVCLAGAGCGTGDEGLVTVTGQVIENGQPVSIPDYEPGLKGIRVAFVPLNDSGEIKDEIAEVANATEDGKFQLVGRMGDGIPPGKYRVAVQRLGDGPGGATEVDLWKGRYSAMESPFVYEIGESNCNLMIDLAEAPPSP